MPALDTAGRARVADALAGRAGAVADAAELAVAAGGAALRADDEPLARLTLGGLGVLGRKAAHEPLHDPRGSPPLLSAVDELVHSGSLFARRYSQEYHPFSVGLTLPPLVVEISSR